MENRTQLWKENSIKLELHGSDCVLCVIQGAREDEGML